MKNFLAAALVLALSACASPTVEESRALLMDRFGGKSIDELFAAWGAPEAETKMTNGARLVTYSHTTFMNFGYYDQYSYNCKASFTAPAPHYKISNVALDGPESECHELARGHTGTDSFASPRAPFFYDSFHHWD